MVRKERKKEKESIKERERKKKKDTKTHVKLGTQVTLEGKNCNLETKDNLETAKFRGLIYFHNPNT